MHTVGCIRDLRYALSNAFVANSFVYTDALYRRYLSVMAKMQCIQRCAPLCVCVSICACVCARVCV